MEIITESVAAVEPSVQEIVIVTELPTAGYQECPGFTTELPKRETPDKAGEIISQEVASEEVQV